MAPLDRHIAQSSAASSAAKPGAMPGNAAPAVDPKYKPNDAQRAFEAVKAYEQAYNFSASFRQAASSLLQDPAVRSVLGNNYHTVVPQRLREGFLKQLGLEDLIAGRVVNGKDLEKQIHDALDMLSTFRGVSCAEDVIIDIQAELLMTLAKTSPFDDTEKPLGLEGLPTAEWNSF